MCSEWHMRAFKARIGQRWTANLFYRENLPAAYWQG